MSASGGSELYVGVDGGGTGTRALVTAADGSVVGEAEGPPAGVAPGRATAAADVVAETVRSALAGAGRSPPVRRLCAALAGGGREPARGELQEALSARGLASGVRVVADAEAAHFDAFGGRAGLLVLAGTGSVAWGLGAGGRRARAGGWGPWVGDEGSGYALGLAAVRATLRAHDGRGEATRLAPAVLRAAGREAAEELVDWVAGASRPEVAALAPMVAEAAGEGDAVAAALLEDAARELEGHLDALLRALESPGGPEERGDPWRVALGGGLLRPGAALRLRLERAVRSRGAEVVAGEVSAVRGAAGLAREEGT